MLFENNLKIFSQVGYDLLAVMAFIGHLTISRPYGPRNVARAQRGCLDPVQATFRGPMALVSPSESTSGGLNGWMDNSGHQPTLQPAHQLLRPRALVPGPSNIPRARANCCSSGRIPLGPRAQGGLLICSQSGPDFCDPRPWARFSPTP